MLCICSGMTCSAYIQLQWRKAVFNLQKILSLQSRTQMIILFLALVGFITFFFADDDNILSYRQGISISWLDWSTTDLLAQVILLFVQRIKNQNLIHHPASNHRRSASSLCEDGKPPGQEVHHVGFQERFLWRYKLLNIII